MIGDSGRSSGRLAVEYSRVALGGYEVVFAILVTYILGIGLVAYWGAVGFFKHKSQRWEYILAGIVLLLGGTLITLFRMGVIP